MSLLALVLLAACDFLDGTPPETTDDDAACPTGFVEAVSPVLVVEDLQVGGISVAATFEGDTTRNGQSAACISEAGTEVRYVLTVNGEGQGLLSVYAADPGEVELADVAGRVRLQLSGTDFPDAVSVDDWESGSVLYVDEVGETFGFSVTNAIGFDPDGDDVSLNVNGQASLP